MAANLSLVISAVDKASATLEHVDKKAGGLGKTLGTALKVGAVAGAAGIGVAVVAGLKFAQMAAKEEVGIKRLGAALDAAGGSWKKQGKAVEEVIRQREKLAFADDDLRDSLSILIAQTGNLDEAMRRQKVAMDFSRGANIDLNTASKLLGKVTDENVNVLRRYGIVVEEGADATKVMEEVQRRFAGQSEAFADTSVGKWERFKNTLSNIQETIGAALLPVLSGLTDLAQRFADRALPAVEGAVEDVSSRVRELATTVFPPVKEVFNDIANTVIPILTGAIDGLVGALKAVAESKEFQAFIDGANEGLAELMVAAGLARQFVEKAFGTIAGAAKKAGKQLKDSAPDIQVSDKAYAELGRNLLVAGAAVAGMSTAIAALPFIALPAAIAIAGLITAVYMLETRLQLFSKVVGPVLEDAFKWMEEHKDTVIAALGGVGTAIMVGLLPAVYAWTAAEIAKASALIASGVAFLIAYGPVLLFLAGIAALAGAIIYLELKTGFLTTAVGWLKGAFEDATDWFNREAIPVIEDVAAAFGDVIAFARDHWPEIATLLALPFAPIVLLATDAFGVRSALLKAFDEMWRGIKGITITGVNWVIESLNFFIGAVNPVLGVVNDILGLFGGGSIGKIGEIAKIGESIGAPTGEQMDKFKAIAELQHGTPRVPRNMLAFLHAGEMVIPARPAERIRRGEAPAAFPPAVTAGGSSPFDYDRLAGTIASALMGFGIDMDGERIGQLIERRLGARANLYGRAG